MKPTFTTMFGSIPGGVMFHQGEGDPVALPKWEGRVWAWSLAGYQEDLVLGGAPGRSTDTKSLSRP